MRKQKMIFIVLLLPSIMLYAQSKTLFQSLTNWPAGCDTLGTHWFVYNINKPESHYVIDTTVASVTTSTYWAANIGNFNGGVNPWANGDTILALGSFDTAYIHDPDTYGNNANHCGFYWLFCDTVTLTTPEVWLPADTVRPIPKPIVTQTGLGAGADDTIWIWIPNPMETDTLEPIDYSVLGYWLVADSTGAGTPNALNDEVKAVEIGFIPVQGDTGDTTVFWILESDMFLAWAHWTTYFAYKIVARPDTVGAPEETMGYSTYYWSQNSDAIDVYQTIIGIEDTNIPTFETGVPDVFPNPSKGQFTVQYNASVRGSGRLELYDVMGRNLGTLWQGTMTQGLNSVSIQYDASGVYFLVFECGNVQKVRKIILE